MTNWCACFSKLVSGLLKIYQAILEQMSGKVCSFGHICFICEDWWENMGHWASTEPSKKRIFKVTLKPLNSGSGQFFFLAPDKSIFSSQLHTIFTSAQASSFTMFSVQWVRNSLKSWSLSLLQRHVDFPGNGLDYASLGKGHAELRLQTDYDSEKNSLFSFFSSTE